MEIKNLKGEVIYKDDSASLRETILNAYKVGAYLRGADLSGAYLSGAYLRGADLSGAYLSGAYLSGADLSGADLRGAYLSGADLSGAYLSGAYLSGADLRGAYLRGAYLRGAYLRGADLRGADLRGAKYADFEIKIAPLSIENLKYSVLIFAQHMKIGCKLFKHSEWQKFTTRQIAEMDGTDGARFWRIWKKPLLEMCRIHAAQARKAK